MFCQKLMFFFFLNAFFSGVFPAMVQFTKSGDVSYIPPWYSVTSTSSDNVKKFINIFET